MKDKKYNKINVQLNLPVQIFKNKHCSPEHNSKQTNTQLIVYNKLKDKRISKLD